MDIIREFLGQIFKQHCPCFVEQCNIRGTTTVIQDLVKNIAQESFVLDKEKPINCNIIYNSGTVIFNEPDESKALVEKFVYYMQKFGLLVPFGKTVNKSSSFSDISSLNNGKEKSRLKNLKEQHNVYLGGMLPSIPSWSDMTERRPKKQQNPLYTLWNGSLLEWQFLIKKLTYNQLPVKFKDICRDLNNDDTVLLCKVLFWFFRKGVVDNTIIAHMPQETGCLALSAGSIDITSDYDVTVYGRCSQLLAVYFDKHVKSLFGNNPDIVFDTNVYSSSFINMVDPENSDWFEKASCATHEFWFLKEQQTIPFDQHVWSAIKVLKALDHLSEKDEDMLILMREIAMKSRLYSELYDIYESLNKITDTSHEIGFNSFNSSKGLSLGDYCNNLSVINYRGSETYFTRGAFLDVVVNQQICKGKSINLSMDAYFDSYVENAADFASHGGKLKYKNRILQSGQTLDDFVQTKKFLSSSLLNAVDSKNMSEILRIVWNYCEEIVVAHPESVAMLQKYANSLAPRRVHTSMTDLTGNSFTPYPSPLGQSDYDDDLYDDYNDYTDDESV